MTTALVIAGIVGIALTGYVFPWAQRRTDAMRADARTYEPWTPELPHTAAELAEYDGLGHRTRLLIDYRPGCTCNYCAAVRAHPSGDRIAFTETDEVDWTALARGVGVELMPWQDQYLRRLDREARRADRPELGGE